MLCSVHCCQLVWSAFSDLEHVGRYGVCPSVLSLPVVYRVLHRLCAPSSISRDGVHAPSRLMDQQGWTGDVSRWRQTLS